MTVPIRVAVVEDDREVREGLTWLMGQVKDLKCLEAFASGEEAVRKLPRSRPDVILLDIDLPGRSGIECLPQLKRDCPNAQISMLTIFEDDDLIFRSLAAGATGYLLKNIPPAVLFDAVRDLHAGASPMSSRIARRLLNVFICQPAWPAAFRRESPGPDTRRSRTDLCPRERQILDLLAQGLRYKEIADQLGITIHTVRTFIRTMYEKLQVHSRTDALNRVRDGH